MPNGRRRPPYVSPSASVAEPPGLLFLDQFSGKSLTKWLEASKDFEQLIGQLMVATKPERDRRRPEILAALAQVAPYELQLNKWTRIVPYQYALNPLSCAGSLRGIGGRFNAGVDLEQAILRPLPCLYIAETHEVAFNEAFASPAASSAVRRDYSLSLNELALQPTSFANVNLNGKLSRLFDLTSANNLKGVAKEFAKIKMPEAAKELIKKLQIPRGQLTMVTSPERMFNSFFQYNWRAWPVQLDIPSDSQVLAELIFSAGFEGIIYKSTKTSAGKCIALFPEQLIEGSFVEIDGPSPPKVLTRLDSTNFESLLGWDTLPSNQRARR
jgi:hypothetical protein